MGVKRLDQCYAYVADYYVWDANEQVPNVDVSVSAVTTEGITRTADFTADFSIDTVNPNVTSVTPSVATISDPTVGTGTFTLTLVFDKDMDQTVAPTISFPGADPTGTITFNAGASGG